MHRESASLNLEGLVQSRTEHFSMSQAKARGRDALHHTCEFQHSRGLSGFNLVAELSGYFLRTFKMLALLAAMGTLTLVAFEFYLTELETNEWLELHTGTGRAATNTAVGRDDNVTNGTTSSDRSGGFSRLYAMMFPEAILDKHDGSIKISTSEAKEVLLEMERIMDRMQIYAEPRRAAERPVRTAGQQGREFGDQSTSEGVGVVLASGRYGDNTDFVVRSQLMEPDSAPVSQSSDSHDLKPDSAPVLQSSDSHDPKPDSTPVSQSSDSHDPKPDSAPVLQSSDSHDPKPVSTPVLQSSDSPDPKPDSTPVLQSSDSPDPKPDFVPVLHPISNPDDAVVARSENRSGLGLNMSSIWKLLSSQDSVTGSSGSRSSDGPVQTISGRNDNSIIIDPRYSQPSTESGSQGRVSKELVVVEQIRQRVQQALRQVHDTEPEGNRVSYASRNLKLLFRRSHDQNLHRKGRHLQSRKQRRSQAKVGLLNRPRKSLLRRWASFWAVVAAVSSVIACMMPGGFRPPHQGGNRNHAHVGDAGPPFVGTATLKVPPAWSVERSQHYSLRAWISDLVLWSSATDVEAHRMGAIAALQISGSAKELVRELPPDQLANGLIDPQTGNQITGLMLLVRTLAQRYAPLEGELSTRAVSDFLNFSRTPGESIDALLVRFDVLRNRAQVRGGLGVNASGLSWLLLKALNLNADLVDRLLQPLGGNLPQDDLQLGQLLERIRRQGHLYEGHMRHPTQQAGLGDPGAYLAFPTFEAEGACRGPQAPGFAAWASTPEPAWGPGGMPSSVPATVYNSFGASVSSPTDDIARMAGGMSASQAFHVGGEDQCASCGTYFDEDDISSATSTDDDAYDPQASAYNTVDVDGVARQDDTARGNVLWNEYVLARRRWRRWAGKPPRRYRRVSFRPNHRAQHKLERGPYARTYSAFLPANAFAGGKGGKGSAGKGKGRGGRNPRGKDGQVMKCARCGSESHLWRKCPQVVGSSAAGTPQQSNWTQQAPAASALTLMTHRPHPVVETWGSGPVGGTGALTGVAFHYIAGRTGSSAGSVLSGSGDAAQSPNQYGTAIDDDLSRLESASQVGSNRKRRSAASSEGPPEWDASEQASAVSQQSAAAAPPVAATATASSSAAGTLLTSVNTNCPRFPPPQQPAPSEEEIARRRTVVQLSSLLHHAWWEGEQTAMSEASGAKAEAYHLRTRLPGDRVGLLVDPGAHDNLIGAETAARIAQQTGIPNEKVRMSRKLQVEGVGKSAQEAEAASRISLCLQDTDGQHVEGTFTAPVIGDSALPPLLGLKSLRRMAAVIDTKKQKMYLPGPGGLEVRCSPGTRTFDLLMSPSGHLILPIDHCKGMATNQASTDAGPLDFAMTVRDPVKSPQRGSRSSANAPSSRLTSSQAE